MQIKVKKSRKKIGKAYRNVQKIRRLKKANRKRLKLQKRRSSS